MLISSLGTKLATASLNHQEILQIFIEILTRVPTHFTELNFLTLPGFPGPFYEKSNSKSYDFSGETLPLESCGPDLDDKISP